MTFTNQMFTYAQRARWWKGVLSITATLSVAVAILYMLLAPEHFLHETPLSELISHTSHHISAGSGLGLFYLGFWGGLFFMFLPVEPLFLYALPDHHPLMAFILLGAGLAISYTLNYQLGCRFAPLFTKLVSRKQFYKLKSILNRHGQKTIFFVNLIGTGSQPLSFIVGIFRYNAVRVASMTILGQCCKLVILITLHTYIWENLKTIIAP